MNLTSMRYGWKTVKFGDIAQNVTVRVNPSEAETDIYVGLEHLDPDTIHLRQWGHPSDVTGQKFVFKKGDVIFGRRRAYQRKLAVAEFDGICSAHAIVLRAKPKMILPEFLPFFLQSDIFMERAIEISVGSLSPTINWKTLSVQEFPLPPLEEQKRIAEILWAADEAVQSYLGIILALDDLFETELNSSILKANCRLLKELCTRITKGTTPTTYGDSYTCEGVPFLRVENITNSVVEISTVNKFISEESHKKQIRSAIIRGDVLVSIAGTIGRVGIVLKENHCEANCNQAVAIIRPKNIKISEFLFFWLQSELAKKQILYKTVTNTISNISLATISNLEVPMPKIDRIDILLNNLKRISSKKKIINKQLERVRYLNSVFLK
jgi:restriction endonuclease S subunit